MEGRRTEKGPVNNSDTTRDRRLQIHTLFSEAPSPFGGHIRLFIMIVMSQRVDVLIVLTTLLQKWSLLTAVAGKERSNTNNLY